MDRRGGRHSHHLVHAEGPWLISGRSELGRRARGRASQGRGRALASARSASGSKLEIAKRRTGSGQLPQTSRYGAARCGTSCLASGA